MNDSIGRAEAILENCLAKQLHTWLREVNCPRYPCEHTCVVTFADVCFFMYRHDLFFSLLLSKNIHSFSSYFSEINKVQTHACEWRTQIWIHKFH